MTTLSVNGEIHKVTAPPQKPLLWVLRDDLNLTGTKYGCGIGQCSACTVHLDGVVAQSCLTTLGAVGERAVTTIEGLSADRAHPVQRAWIALEVPQCGYCQSGQIMAAAALLAATPRPDDAQIDAAMRRNLCRCGTYQRVRAAIHRAAAQAPA